MFPFARFSPDLHVSLDVFTNFGFFYTHTKRDHSSLPLSSVGRARLGDRVLVSLGTLLARRERGQARAPQPDGKQQHFRVLSAAIVDIESMGPSIFL